MKGRRIRYSAAELAFVKSRMAMPRVPKGEFYGWVRTDKPVDNWFTFLTQASRRVELMNCTRCSGWWFADPDHSWQCQCCGACDGNGHLAGSIPSPLPEFPNVHALHFLAPNV